MADISRVTIEKSLLDKGFKPIKKGKSTDHKWYAFVHKNREYRHIAAKISHGSGYKTYGDSLLNMMKKLLQLDKLQEVRDLLGCPMGKQQYLTILIDKGLLNNNSVSNQKEKINRKPS